MHFSLVLHTDFSSIFAAAGRGNRSRYRFFNLSIGSFATISKTSVHLSMLAVFISQNRLSSVRGTRVLKNFCQLLLLGGHYADQIIGLPPAILETMGRPQVLHILGVGQCRAAANAVALWHDLDSQTC